MSVPDKLSVGAALHRGGTRALGHLQPAVRIEPLLRHDGGVLGVERRGAVHAVDAHRQADGHVTFEIDENSPVNIKQKQAFHGLYRALVNNMVVGVSEGYKKEMELVGVGYRVSNQGNIIEFALGYTHPIFIQLPKEVKVETKSERNQNPQIILESCDKQLLGLICAKIRSFRMPEPYKGKGILFKGEVIRRKSGKSASAK